MTTILLIRHGQASFGTDNYDRLSELGVRQSLLIGEELVRRANDEIFSFSGELTRQRDTARHAMSAFNRSRDTPVLYAFNEYDIDALLAAYLPRVIADSPRLAAAGEGFRLDKRLYLEALSGVTALWAGGVDALGIESWANFRVRLNHGLMASLHGRGKNDTIAIFTSGGVITAILGEILDLKSDKVFALNWRIYNGSISEVHYGRNGFSVSSFNSVGHLVLGGSADLLTYW